MTVDAALGGRPVALDEAIAAAARLLGGARRFVIAGLDADVAAAQAGIKLAHQRGGAVDHVHAASALRGLRVMRESGWIVTTPMLVRAIADVVLLAGPGPEELRRDLVNWLWLDRAPSLHRGRTREVLRLDAAGTGLTDALRLLRMQLSGRAPEALPAITQAAAALRAARYAVVVWSAADAGLIDLELLCGLVEDLNAETRCAGLPLPTPGNVNAVMHAATWTTGLPLPLGFDGPNGPPRHDPWRYDAARLCASREVDAAIWVSTGDAAPDAWPAAVPTVALTGPGIALARPPAVSITVGRPGIDHDAVLFDDDLLALAHRRATAPSALPPAAEVIGRIAQALPPC